MIPRGDLPRVRDLASSLPGLACCIMFQSARSISDCHSIDDIDIDIDIDDVFCLVRGVKLQGGGVFLYLPHAMDFDVFVACCSRSKFDVALLSFSSL